MRLFMTVALLLTTQCFLGRGVTAQADESEEAGREYFEKSVRPILVEHCYQCHSGREANGGLLLDNREGVLKGGDSGPVIVARDPERSLLIHAVRYSNPDLQMPPKSRLAETEIKLLENWVARGAPDPRNAVPTGGGPKPAGMSIEDGREFWSFRQVSKPELPEVQDQNWEESHRCVCARKVGKNRSATCATR